LTSRIFVNRLWMLYFGQGIVKTADDFGALGAWPTHPELLDWLALDFQASGGDIKRAIKQIVLSATYRQSSKGTPDLRQHDPYNQLLARQGRFRLDAEFVRDNALAISGLLVTKVGGPSVKPYQPEGLLALHEFPGPQMGERQGRKPISPRACTRTGNAPSCNRACSRSMPRRARSAPSNARARTRRSKRWCS